MCRPGIPKFAVVVVAFSLGGASNGLATTCQDHLRALGKSIAEANHADGISAELRETARNFALSPNDPLFKSGYLPVKGRSMDFKETLREISLREKRIRNLSSVAHEALLFHGSRSSSLLAFTKYNNYAGKLVPMGQLEAQGKIPFSGEVIWGRGSLNQNHLSTTFITRIDRALRYAGESPLFKESRSPLQNIKSWLRGTNAGNGGWSPERGKKVIKTAELELKSMHSDEGSLGERAQRNIIAVNEARMREFQKLSREERNLIEMNFPVLYGARIQRDGVMTLGNSDIPHEIAVKDGIALKELKVIFVPRAKKDFVKALLDENLGPSHGIFVEDISLIVEAPR